MNTVTSSSANSPPSPPSSRCLDCLAIFGGTAALAAVLFGARFAATEYGPAITRYSIHLSLAWYALALFLMLRLNESDWAAVTLRGRLARWCWTWGVSVFLVHLAMAFQYFHHWSHAHAFEHTREVSGWGEGIYFSYLFTLLWAADTSWWWLNPSTYAARGVWLHRSIHAYLLFIVFNGTVVFESGAIRWLGAAATVALALTWLATLRRRSLATHA